MLTNRPVLVPETMVVRVISHGPDKSVYLTIDGQVGMTIQEDDVVVCRSSQYSLHLVRPPRMMFFDVLRRYLEWSGYQVRYVSNITDIEDKIIRRALAEGRSTDEIVATYEKAWWDAMKGLGVLPPDEEPHATAYVPQMVDSFGRMSKLAGGLDRMVPGHDPLVLQMYPAPSPELRGAVARLDSEPDLGVLEERLRPAA